MIGSDFQGLIDAAVNAELHDFPTTKKEYWKQIGDALSYAGYARTELGDEVAERIEARFFELTPVFHKRSYSPLLCLQERLGMDPEPAENRAANRAANQI